MKKRLLSLTLCLLLALSGLTACGKSGEPEAESTLENIFTTPTTEAASQSTEPDSQATDPSSPESPNPFFGGISHGFSDETLINEKGRYNIYEGGEMHIDYFMAVSGNVAKDGVGLLVILDGQPQPYKTAEEDNYSYLHTFYPTPGKRLDIEMIMTPVTGQEGDTLELTVFHLLGPDYYSNPNEMAPGMRQTSGSTFSSTQLVFQATPPKAELPDTPERVAAQSVEYPDLTSADLAGWTAEELQTDSSYEFATNYTWNSGYIFGVSPEKNLTIRSEVFGSTAVEWSYILYVNHQPVSVLPENQVMFRTQNGKKTVIETTLDMSDFDGEGIIYAMFYVRNWRDWPSLNFTASPVFSSTHYLTDAENLQAMKEKYN